MTGSGLSFLPPALDFVFYAASSDSPKEEAYRSAYSVGIRNLIESLVEQGQTLTRLVFTSSTGIYTQQSGEWVDEDSPAEPTDASAQYFLE